MIDPEVFMLLDPQQTYLSLGPNGVVTPVAGGEAFWRTPHADLTHVAVNWLVSEYVFDADWPSWEMHPHADELVYLLSGAAQLHIEQEDDVEVVALSVGRAVLVPRARWHTAKVILPCRLLHITLGEGTLTRPV